VQVRSGSTGGCCSLHPVLCVLHQWLPKAPELELGVQVLPGSGAACHPGLQAGFGVMPLPARRTHRLCDIYCTLPDNGLTVNTGQEDDDRGPRVVRQGAWFQT
jgi:hypothetical protein